MTNNFIQEFIEQSIYRIKENTPRIEKCLNLLTEDEVWHQPNASTNSIANLILHLCGNIRQYAVSSLGYKDDLRERDLEFSIKGGLNKSQLTEKLTSTIEAATSIIEKLDEKELLKIRSVQGFEFSGIGIIIHVTEHYSYHTGQIALITKLLKNKDLGFFAGRDLNIKNKNNEN
ncbi:DinB family protein [Abyssalbus ytuae]|uniref:DUF1572 domain-containing protein n=1 Tax=Abyssalbus ytuae TaxID=2926907 RepID=A0A9E6ZX05_9FLAO|nr:DinB family protein [Abyssalbus ytuae]UOB19303.1 DUF1572 domain-containing protein [Abyssalbus ytuae]